MSVRRELVVGEVLYRQGEPSDCAWLVERGAVELISHQGRRATQHGTYGPGQLIGELGMLDGAPRSATATARDDTVLLAIEHDQFLERLASGDPIVRTLVDSLLHRIRNIIASLPDDLPLPTAEPLEGDTAQRSGIDKIRLEAQLRDALENGTLDVCYQPIFNIPGGRITDYEALVRWQLPELGVISPAEFIELAEETSLIVPVGDYVLDHAIALLSDLRDSGAVPLPSIAANISARQLVEPGMAHKLMTRLQRAGLPHGALKLEITESRMLDYAEVSEVMQLCRKHGVPFALDDFGTGYSNLGHLHALPFDFLKLDQMFTRQMCEQPRTKAIVEAIVAMAHGIGAQVICEGVETPEQLQWLRQIGVRYAQGYLFGQAASAAAVLSGEAARGLAPIHG